LTEVHDEATASFRLAGVVNFSPVTVVNFSLDKHSDW